MLLATAGAAASLLVWARQFFPFEPPPSAHLIISAYQALVAPEPTERFIFSILAVAMPVLALVLTVVVSRIGAREPGKAVAYWLPLVIATLLFVPFPYSDFIATLLGNYGRTHPHDGEMLVASLIVSALWCFGFARLRLVGATSLRARVGLLIAWLTFASVVALQLLSWRLVSFSSVTKNVVWSTSADPVFFALSQVVAGKTLLVDLPSQYGLFPEFLAPLFRVAGLSVAKLSALFAGMQVLSMAALFYTLSRFVKSRMLLAVSGIALALITFETVLYFTGIEERYYQYWPIRFFWPAVSVLAFHVFSAEKTLGKGALLSLVGATGLVWNLDSGIFVIVAYGAYLLGWLAIRWLQRFSGALPAGTDRWSTKSYLVALALHISITAGIVVGFLGFLTWKVHGPLNLQWLFEYQRIFASIGLMMLPLPRELHPWMSILGVYLAGLLIAFNGWQQRGASARADMLFYLSMLGLGLFVYYAGRSHVLNLVSVCWPSVLIVAIVTDDLLRAIRARLLPLRQIWIPIAGLALLLLACSSFIARVPLLYDRAGKQFASRGVAEEAFVKSELALIRRYSTGSRECLILSQRQGIYYAEAGLASPIKGPGLVETLFKADEQKIIQQLLDGQFKCVFLGIGPDSAPGFDFDLLQILAKYSAAATNDQNTMLFLRPKPHGDPRKDIKPQL